MTLATPAPSTITSPSLAPVSRHELVVLGAGVVTRHPMPAVGELLIGRDASCTIRIADESVSRRHASIAITARGFSIRDLGSTNGTTAHGRAVGLVPVPFASDEVIRVGGVALVIQQAQSGPSGGRTGLSASRSEARPIPAPHGAMADLRRRVAEEERAHILAALAQTGGNQKAAAALLGISRRTLLNKLDTYEIARPRKRSGHGE